MTICRAGVATVLQLVLGVGDDKLWQALAGVVDDVDDAEEEATKKKVNEEEVRKLLQETKNWATNGYNKSQGKSSKRRQPIERRRRNAFVNNPCSSFGGYVNIEFGQ